MLLVSFDANGETTSATLEFDVMQGLSLDIIVGLPAICNHFRDVLGEMMGKVFFSTPNEEEPTTLHQVDSQPLIDPNILTTAPTSAWKHSATVISQEELMIPRWV